MKTTIVYCLFCRKEYCIINQNYRWTCTCGFRNDALSYSIFDSIGSISSSLPAYHFKTISLIDERAFHFAWIDFYPENTIDFLNVSITIRDIIEKNDINSLNAFLKLYNSDELKTQFLKLSQSLDEISTNLRIIDLFQKIKPFLKLT